MRRIPELDGLRCLAAVGIIGFHYAVPGLLYRWVFYAGEISLELFFVLSGFLISSIILAHSGEPGFLRAFYVRRGLRIWPIYYLTVLAFGLLALAGKGEGDPRALPAYLTFTQYVPHYWFGEPRVLAHQLAPTWSLAVEEQYYILWPLLILAFGRGRMVAVAAALILVAIGARAAGFNPWILLARCDGFAIGGLLAVVFAKSSPDGLRRARVAQILWVGLGATFLYLTAGYALLGVRPFDVGASPASAVDRALLAAMFACAIGLTLCHEGSRFLAPLRWRWVTYLGLISYGLYLYHLPVLSVVRGVGSRLRLPDAITRGLIAPAACLAVASASWSWIEKPCLKLKDRFRYGPVLVPTRIEPVAAEAERSPLPVDETPSPMGRP